ncbi:hypothetical protein GCM10022225_22140 [Plantactinospora mayteni]|uniref:Uncharacterized protein n=1 Tax=Plantactinospora mayteni TaxID=566021 RepID=A0ABQ4EP15_9ACTN|nr:hypothetical protein [Plantactinospora mayteni]GIG96396.1 hypothetical protein Pma05_29690 [Plantactinospora mayteni]
MSYLPSGTWHAPVQPAPTSAPPAPSVWWRIGHSWWLLLPVLGFSCLAGFGFLYIGLRARRPAWWLPGIGYLVVSWTCFILIGGVNQGTALSDWAAGIFLLSWLASITHAGILNSSWLRWRAGHRPWYAPPPHAPGWPVTGSHQTGHFGAPPVSPGYPPSYGPGSPVAPASPALAGPPPMPYQPTSGPPTGGYPPTAVDSHLLPPVDSYPPTAVDSYLPPPVDPYASPPLDPDLPPPVDPYSGPLPGQEPPSPPHGYR